MPGQLAVGKARERTAAARAALGDASIEVVSALLPLVAVEVERKLDLDDEPLIAALTAVLCSTADGIRLASALVRDLPEVLPLVALALASSDEAPSLSLPAELRAELARALDPIIAAGDEAGMLALELLSRFSLGDAGLVDRIVDAGVRNGGYAQQILASLAHVQRRSARAASTLAPWLENREHLGATMMAAAVAGVVLPQGHPLWEQIRELYALGSLAAAAAHAALTSGVRFRCED